MTTTHSDGNLPCFRWYGKCKHMNRIWVTIKRTCKRTAQKIGYRQQIGIEHQDLQCKRGLRVLCAKTMLLLKGENCNQYDNGISITCICTCRLYAFIVYQRN